MTNPLLSVKELAIRFDLEDGPFTAVSNLSFELEKGKTLGLVGESGSGKSLTALSLLRLVPKPGKISEGEIEFDGKDIRQISEESMRQLRGKQIAVIFQEPMTALNPVVPIGVQVAEPLIIHGLADKAEAHQRAVQILERVGIAGAAQRALDYPHNLSGGMRQRAMIAQALICQPDILIADEATTALDTTVQAQILDLLLDLQEEFQMAILFISHNLGVISEIADDVMVMYGGNLMERAPAGELFSDPQHPYTKALLNTLPQATKRGEELPIIRGNVPSRYDQLSGCRFAPRCNLVSDQCHEAIPPTLSEGSRQTACINTTVSV